MTSADGARDLRGLTVALLQARHAREIAAVVEKHGGVAVSAPCLRESPAEDRDAVHAAVRTAVAAPLDIAVFLTGCGTAWLFGAAVEAGVYGDLMERLAAAVVVARGPKPLAVLHRHRVPVDRRTREPHTTAEVMEIVAGGIEGRTVLLQHYGSPNTTLATFLRQGGASLVEVHPYGWGPPLDPEPVFHFLDLLESGRVDITAFTSAAQVDALFHLARVRGVDRDLPRWLADRTVVAAIGPVCARALQERGIRVRIMPERPKMVPLVLAMCEHAARTPVA